MKRSITTLVPVFNTNRMVEEYAEKCYAPSHARFGTMMAGDRAAAKELAAWRKRIAGEWHEVRIEGMETLKADDLHVGGSFDVRVKVHLGSRRRRRGRAGVLRPARRDGRNRRAEIAVAQAGQAAEAGFATFTGAGAVSSSGQFGFTVRVLPKHPNLPNPFEPGLVTWG